jgi:hypothetical protein
MSSRVWVINSLVATSVAFDISLFYQGRSPIYIARGEFAFLSERDKLERLLGGRLVLEDHVVSCDRGGHTASGQQQRIHHPFTCAMLG